MTAEQRKDMHDALDALIDGETIEYFSLVSGEWLKAYTMSVAASGSVQLVRRKPKPEMKVTQPKFHRKAWGREDWIVNCPEYCCKLLTLNAGMRCSYHRHQTKKETFYVLQGIVSLERENAHRVLLPSDTVTIEPKQWHRFSSLRGATMLEVSTHHSEDDVERKEPSGSMQPEELT